MKASLNWIKNFIEIEKPLSEVANVLTSTGLEVEHFEESFSVKGGLQGIVIGEVLACEKHPNADKLSLTKVDVGRGNLLPIVCGAPNVAVGQKVLVATVGTKIYPANSEPFSIQKAKIRGENSEGMICAEDEIGLGQSHDGILILPNDALVGSLASNYFKIEKDGLFEIGLTANRGDAASQYGIARELSTVFDKPLLFPETIAIQSKIPLKTKIEVKNAKACARFSALEIYNIKVSESPDWLKKALNSIGLKSINSIVDITNFVLHELGQPLHAYDLDKLKNDHLVVDTAKENDVFIALDERKITLKGNELMIFDDEKHCCIAGVYGGAESGVTVETQNILLESAYFSPDNVRKAAKQHGLNTDSSFRFERGTNPEMTIKALERAVFLLEKVSEKSVETSAIFDFYPKPIPPFQVKLKLSNILKVAGIEIPNEKIAQILTGLEIKILDKKTDVWQLEVPVFKSDVTREIDVIEELLRIYGLNQIPLKKELNASLNYGVSSNDGQAQKTVSLLLKGKGFNEIMTNSLSSDKFYENKDELVYLSNPLSNEMNVMRGSMVYSCLESVAHNKNRKQTKTHFFEFGKTYLKKGDKTIEIEVLFLLVSGNQYNESWDQKSTKADYFYLKSVVQNLFAQYKVNPKKQELFQLSNALKQQFGIKDDVYYTTIDWKNLINSKGEKVFVLKDIPAFPAIRRDLSLVLDKSVTFKQIEEIVKAKNSKILSRTNVFDVYEGKPLENTQKSLSISFEFYDETKTLSDAEIDPIMNGLMSDFETKVQATIRR